MPAKKTTSPKKTLRPYGTKPKREYSTIPELIGEIRELRQQTEENKTDLAELKKRVEALEGEAAEAEEKDD